MTRISGVVSWFAPVALVVLLAIPSAASAAELVHWWKADGDFNDAVAGNHGSGAGDTTFATGFAGQAFSFDGTDDYVAVPDATSHHFAGSFSIDTWVSTTSTSGIIAVYYDCAQFCPNTPSLYAIWVNGGKAYGVVRDAAATGGDFGQAVTGGPDIHDGSFHHVSVVRDVEAGTLSVYVDYVLAAEEALEAQADGPMTSGDSEADPLTIGAQFEGGTATPVAELTGLVDDLRLWTGANHPPRSTARPAISGSAVDGETLTCSPGDWTGSPSFDFQWLRDGSPIAGAVAARYTLTTLDVGGQIACRVTATNTGGSPTALSGAVTPAGAPEPPLPPGPLTLEDLPPLTDDDVGRIAQVAPQSGTVLVGIPGVALARMSARVAQKGITFVPLAEAREIPVGSFFDTRRGTVRLRSATGSGNGTQTGDFDRGLFQLAQSRARRGRGLTELRLKGGSFKRCGASSGRSASAALSRRTVRRLRSNATGRFRSRGRNSSATVRGTVWITTDRCDGTLTQVRRGRVAVRDFRRQRTIVLRRGESYLARVPG